jgi:hypothetical protein
VLILDVSRHTLVCFCGLTFFISFFAVTGLVSVVLRHQTLALISRRVSLTYGLHLFKVSSFTLSYHGPFEVVQLLPLLHGTLLVPWALMATKIFTPLAVSPSISHLHLQIVGQARRLPRRYDPFCATIPSAPATTSLNILLDIFLGHHSTRSRISVFYADLPT